jgi:pumilio family protein 6
MVKVLKPHIERMCMDDEAQVVLFTALDVIEYVLLRTEQPSQNL